MARIVCQSTYAAAAKGQTGAQAEDPSGKLPCQDWKFRASVGTWLLPQTFAQFPQVVSRSPYAVAQEGKDNPLVSVMPSFSEQSFGHASWHWNLCPSGTTALPSPCRDMVCPPATTSIATRGATVKAEDPSVSIMPTPEPQCRRWNFRPSVGTWLLPPSCPRMSHQSLPDGDPKYRISVILNEIGVEARPFLSAEQQAELELRQADFNLFWRHLDEEAEDEQFAYMVAEFEIRQATFAFFWQQLDEAEGDEQFASMLAELEIRQAAFNFFWQQEDEAEEHEKFVFMEGELNIRQSAFNIFWQQLDASAAQCQQAVEEPASAEQLSSNTYGFVMAGSPAKNLRRLAKDSASAVSVKFELHDSWSSKLSTYFKLTLDSSGSQDGQKSGRAMTRSSSTSAMALDLGLKEEPQSSHIKMFPSAMGSRSSSLSALRPVKTIGLGKSARAKQWQDGQFVSSNESRQLSSRTDFQGWDMSSSLWRK